jgi:hypothetical protein
MSDLPKPTIGLQGLGLDRPLFRMRSFRVQTRGANSRMQVLVSPHTRERTLARREEGLTLVADLPGIPPVLRGGGCQGPRKGPFGIVRGLMAPPRHAIRERWQASAINAAFGARRWRSS